MKEGQPSLLSLTGGPRISRHASACLIGGFLPNTLIQLDMVGFGAGGVASGGGCDPPLHQLFRFRILGILSPTRAADRLLETYDLGFTLQGLPLLDVLVVRQRLSRMASRRNLRVLQRSLELPQHHLEPRALPLSGIRS